MNETEVGREAMVIEALATYAASGDLSDAYMLSIEAQKMLLSSGQDERDALNKQFAADRQKSGGSLPDIHISDELLTVKQANGQESYAPNGAMMATGDDKLNPPRVK